MDRRRAEYYEIARKLQGLDKSSSSATSRGASISEAPIPEQTVTGVAGEWGLVSETTAVGSPADSLAASLGRQDLGDSRSSASEPDEGARLAQEKEPSLDGGRGVSVRHNETPADGADDKDDAVIGTHTEMHSARPASSSERISEEDLRAVATTIVKRLGTGRPLKPDVFVTFSETIDRMVRDLSEVP